MIFAPNTAIAFLAAPILMFVFVFVFVEGILSLCPSCYSTSSSTPRKLSCERRVAATGCQNRPKRQQRKLITWESRNSKRLSVPALRAGGLGLSHCAGMARKDPSLRSSLISAFCGWLPILNTVVCTASGVPSQPPTGVKECPFIPHSKIYQATNSIHNLYKQ